MTSHRRDASPETVWFSSFRRLQHLDGTHLSSLKSKGGRENIMNCKTMAKYFVEERRQAFLKKGLKANFQLPCRHPNNNGAEISALSRVIHHADIPNRTPYASLQELAFAGVKK